MTQTGASPSVGEAEITHDRHKLEIEVQAKKSVAEKMQAFWDAEKELKAAMPGTFSALNVPRLEKAIEVAKANDVHLSNPKSVEAAEKALRDGRAKAELAASKVKKPTVEQEKKAETSAKKQAEEGLKAAMPNVFNPVYPDRLKSAIDAAKEVGADPSKIAAAELALEAALEHKETEAAHKEYETVVAARNAEKAAEKRAESQEKAKAKAEAKQLRDAELELKAAMPGVFVEKASAAELQAAIAKAKAAGVKELPIAAAEAALQEARDSERLAASAKAAAAARKKMEAEEKEKEKTRNKAEALEKAKAKAEFDAMVAAEVELKAAMPTVFSPAYPARLTDAIAEAKQTGVTRQLVAEAEAALREVPNPYPIAHEATHGWEGAARTVVATGGAALLLRVVLGVLLRDRFPPRQRLLALRVDHGWRRSSLGVPGECVLEHLRRWRLFTRRWWCGWARWRAHNAVIRQEGYVRQLVSEAWGSARAGATSSS